MALSTGDRVSEIVYADDAIENYDQSERLELEGLIESMPPNPKHSGFVSASGDLPTPTVGHPSEEGIFMREIMLLGFILQLKLHIFSRPIVND
jgi:hypothetical protein